MSGILSYIYSMISQASAKKEQAAELIEKCREKERKIEYEHLSKDYHDAECEVAASQQSLEKLENDLPKLRRRKDSSEHEYRCMAAAKLYEKIQKASDMLIAERNTINTIKNNEQSRRINDLGYSLYKKYYEDILLKDSQRSEELRNQERLKAEDASLVEHSDEISRKINDFNKEYGRLELLLEQFESFKTKCREQLGSLPDENLLGELDAGSTAQHQKRIQNEINCLQISIENKRKKKLSAEKMANEAIDNLGRIELGIADTEYNLADNEKRSKEFAAAYKKTKGTAVRLRNRGEVSL